MQIIPIRAVPNQALTVTLGGQPCQINIVQKSTGVFLDLYVEETRILVGVICQDRNPVVRSVYLGFTGDLAFVDTQGEDDPTYTGFGTRFILCYLVPGDFIAAAA